MKILIAGASGLIGRPLVASLEAEGAEVTRLVRSAPNARAREIEWHPEGGMIDAAGLEGHDAVINLAGDGIADGRWTAEKKRRIRDSRVMGTWLLSESLARLSQKPKTFICASAIGFYGDRGDEMVDETSDPGRGFLVDVCRAWESATEPAAHAGIRVVNLRLGVVLTKDGGVMGSMLLPFRLGVGGPVGSGSQFISWVAMDDVVRAANFILDKETLSGPINLVAPQPVTNRAFAKTFGHILSRPAILPMPALVARLMFGEMADELMLSSTRVAPTVLMNAGFGFRYPGLQDALRHVMSQ